MWSPSPNVDGERFLALGARPVTVSGNLKVDTNPPPVDERALTALQRQIGPRPTWAAVSTHDGEETVAAEVHAMLRPRHPGPADHHRAAPSRPRRGARGRVRSAWA